VIEHGRVQRQRETESAAEEKAHEKLIEKTAIIHVKKLQ
jgi:hypothetical protein